MKFSASCTYGATAIRHDNREYTPPNADKNLEMDNEYLVISNGLEQDYEQIFGQAVEEYNAKQKRADRKIENYFQKIKNSKNGEKVSYEYVLQMGDRNTNPVGGEHQDITKEIYRQYVAEFQDQNPNMRLINATIHCDEPNGTPHLHITVIPVAHSNRGLTLKNSLSGAMREMGYKEPADWALEQQEALAEQMRCFGIDREHIGCQRPHIENGLYQELKDQLNAELQFELQDLREEVQSFEEYAVELEDEVANRANKLLSLDAEIEQKELVANKLDQQIEQSHDALNKVHEELERNVKVLNAAEKYIQNIKEIFPQMKAELVQKVGEQRRTLESFLESSKEWMKAHPHVPRIKKDRNKGIDR